MNHIRIIEEISRHLWAVSHPALDAMVRIVSIGEELEERSIFHGSVITVEQRKEEIAAEAGEGDGDQYRYSERYGSMGIIHIDGPLIPREAGQAPSQPRLTTTAGLIRDFEQMESDPRIDRIALLVDSPGGAVTGISEFASSLMNSSKPNAAYIEGMAASAAYWVSCAADVIVGSNTSNFGAIGVVARIDASKDKNTVKVISSQSPFKHADPTTKEGKQQYQGMVDDIADVFVNTVAENRGTTREDVLENYGKGGVVIASRAEAKGMIDAVMTRKQFLADFSGDLEACWWLRKGGGRGGKRAMVEENIDAVENGDRQLNLSTARAEENNERIDEMKLEDLLKENPEAKSEFHSAISKAETEARTALRKELELAVKVMAGDEYPKAVKAVAADYIKGEKSKETLDAVMAVAEMNAEKENSDKAKQASAAQGTTPPALVENEPSVDGKIKTTADFYAAIGKKPPVAGEVK